MSDVLAPTAHALLVRLADEQRTARTPSLVGGVVRDGVLLWSGGRGKVDGAEPDSGTQYRIGSISKTFTAVLVARLRDEGKLDFADPLDRHVPGTTLGDRTIGQLLAHTSGVQAETSGPWWERTPGGAWDTLAGALSPALHRGGELHHYSNLGYAVLGEVISRLRGASWFDALQGEILRPLGLTRTSFSPEAPHALGYAVHPWADVVLEEPFHDAGAMAPAGQLWSTVVDLARWAAFIGGDTGEVLSADTLTELREPNTVERSDTWVSGYGLGLQVLHVGGRTFVGHGGSMPGFLAGVYVDVADSTAGVCAANTTSGVNPVRLGTDLVSILAEHEPRVPAEWAPDPSVPASVLELVGPWYWGPTPFALHAKADGWLDLTPLTERGRASRFRPTGTDTWQGLDGYYLGETLRVVRLADGSVSHLDLASFVFTRSPYDPDAPVPGGVEGWR
ncbi:serine hydrolase domain-containing protein [Tenggerimyces flavus]|uniref:Serine hydrolase domain-containing protein n=1 Tax=Tenggerimyces flavus TaxID=1708749 RepID=A0ABV7YKE2_9ACTN|nr:serine hydrolase domain-containing protein [Tenggerimyces flavus]MBM7783969.1 CubicO group peptidase (beta-lactamase class C family) [Tenggerimyces flavus]